VRFLERSGVLEIADEASRSGKVQDEDLANLMEELGLEKEELDDMIFEEEGLAIEDRPRWLAIARVHTDTPYNQNWFFSNMRSAWGLAQDVKFRAMDSNLYILHLFFLGDWEKVMEGGLNGSSSD
jgi:hypothetical protein